MLKKTLPLLAAFTLLLGSISYGASGVEIEDYRVEKESYGKIDVVIPRIKGLKTMGLRKEVSNLTRTLVDGEIRKFNDRLFDKDAYFNVDYELMVNKDIISIIIRKDQFRDGRNIPILDQYINIDTINNRVLSLGDMFKDEDYLDTVGALVKEKDPRFVLKGTEDFYLDEAGGLTIIFNNEEKLFKDIVAISFSQEEIKDYLTDDALLGLVYFKDEVDLDLEGDISVIMPEIKGLKTKELEEEVNRVIKEAIDKEIEKFKLEAKDGEDDLEFKVNYKYGEVKDLITIEVNVYKYIEGVNTGETVKYFYNIDNRNNKLLSLGDLFIDPGYLDKVNGIVSARIEASSKDFYQDEKKFKSIREDQKFYIDKYGNLVICFDQYEIGSRSAGLPEFRIPFYELRNNVRNEFKGFGVSKLDKVLINTRPVELEASMYITENGNLMLPISELSKDLGLDLSYDEEGKLYRLKYRGEESSFSIRENLYSLNDAKVFLEEEARLKDGVLFLPERYIDDVLKLEISVEDGVLSIKK